MTPDTTILDDSAPVTAAQLRALENRLARSERRLRMTWGAALAGVVGAFALGLTPAAQAQYGVTLQSLQNQINALTPRVAAVETKTQFLSVSGGEMFVTGTNLHIRDGSGDTSGEINGLGNLIIGYNELRGDGDIRAGSHNLIVGSRNNYSSFGGFVAGASNSISGPYSSVSGGYLNEASGTAASVISGEKNVASGFCSSVSGGNQNTASGDYASVSGGLTNEASGPYASISGGSFNTASFQYASVSGGSFNTASGQASSVSGGAFRSSTGQNDWRAGTLFQDQ